jgi:hypothetical protein
MQEMNWGNHQYLTWEGNIMMDLKEFGLNSSGSGYG